MIHPIEYLALLIFLAEPWGGESVRSGRGPRATDTLGEGRDDGLNDDGDEGDNGDDGDGEGNGQR